MTKRDRIYNKYNGLCAYTGKQLVDNWQIDHQEPKRHAHWYMDTPIDCDENLFPALRIVNHYKRGHNLESFRLYMRNFHVRLSKCPKNPKVSHRIRYKEYMNEIADAFGITVDKPFCGKFFFETNNVPEPPQSETK